MAENTQAKSTLTRWQRFKLKTKLFEIWFIKNIFIFIWIFFIVCVGLALGGYITKETFILGPIFGGISSGIKAVLVENNANITVYTIIETLVTISSILILSFKKMKRLGLEDIKSRKVKIMLVKAGLYFNEDGKLTKRLETITGQDLDGDGQIGDKPIEATDGESIFKGIKRAGEEFVTIVKLDLSDVEVGKEQEVYEHVGLDDEKEGIDELIVDTSNKAASLLDPTIDEAKVDDNIEVTKKNVFRRLWLSVKSFGSGLTDAFKKSKDLEKIETEDIDVNKKKEKKVKKQVEIATEKLDENINQIDPSLNNSPEVMTIIETPDIDVNLTEKETSHEEEVKEEENKTTVKEEVKAEEKPVTSQTLSASQANLDDFLASLKK